MHVLRAASDISGEKSFVLVGSQAILLLLNEPDDRLTVSVEIDLYPAMAPEKAEKIDGAIGVLSHFHDTHGYHADGVSPNTASLPPDWMTRSLLHYFGDITAICPEIHDLAVSKCVAGREKDAQFVSVLLQAKHIDLTTLLGRIALLDGNKHDIHYIRAWARRRAQEAGIA
jgi:hypothetical protein